VENKNATLFLEPSYSRQVQAFTANSAGKFRLVVKLPKMAVLAASIF